MDSNDSAGKAVKLSAPKKAGVTNMRALTSLSAGEVIGTSKPMGMENPMNPYSAHWSSQRRSLDPYEECRRGGHCLELS